MNAGLSRFAILSLLVAIDPSGRLPAQTPGWGAAQWNFPPTASSVFECVEAYPRIAQSGGTSDPGDWQAAKAAHPTLRPSGIRGFTDDYGTPMDPNDDREYMVVGRSDGIFLIDATPQRDPGPAPNAGGLRPGIPPFASRKVLFLGEPTPVLSSYSDYLNGLINGQTTGVPYIWPPTHTWMSDDTTNREVACYKVLATATAPAQYFLYSVNTWREGLWVVELTRNAAGELVVLASNWRMPTIPAGHTLPRLGACHNIDVDPVAGRQALYVTDDTNHLVARLDLTTPAFPGNALIVASGSGFHDAMPYKDYLVVSVTGTPEETRILSLGNPPTPWITFPTFPIPGTTAVAPQGHSAYLDFDTPLVEPRLYTLIEEELNPAGVLNQRSYTILSVELHDGAVDSGCGRSLSGADRSVLG